MNNDIVYKLYSVKDVKDWLYNSIDNGLSEAIISKPRAYAIINCPFVTDSDSVISAVFSNGKSIGYTAVFPEKFVRPQHKETYFWGTTQWIEPEYRGLGISGKMMLNIKESVKFRYLGLDSSISSIKLDQKQGAKIVYYPRYFILFDRQDVNNIKLKIRRLFIKLKNYFVKNRVEKSIFANKYISFIDDQTYSFICEHSHSSIFLRSRDFINWQLHYPFVQSTGDDKHVKDDSNQFLANVKSQWIKAWQIFVGDLMVGVCVLRCIDGVCTVAYLYYDSHYQYNVFSSIVYIILQSKIIQFRTFSKELFDFATKNGVKGLNSKHHYENVALTLPGDWIEDDITLTLQGGDGDMFC